ncbi:MAG TPA: D-alanyl-D-alanine carboxypeptidase/D-alanyl-D-alanine-endopeptidase [Candidatus Acidoferrales bacterium]|nr:D-alanyl-D-alanine carboxypeptidase/D-alanyl-D-alanine-endopeptidase [Candidatus Acidoferrales bacterium]
MQPDYFRRTIRIGILFSLLCSFVSLSVYAAPKRKSKPSAIPGIAQFQREVRTVLAAPNAQKALIGALIVDADTKQPIYELNADRYLTPASNTKLFTTALAMNILGPDYRFRTTIETHGTLDSAGRLRGDLVLVGRGDPDFSNRTIPYNAQNPIDGPSDKPLAEMVDAIVAKGVKEIDGEIVGDDSYFPYEPYPYGWAVGDLTEDYGAAVSAICFDDNGLDIKVTPGDHVGAPVWVTVEPWPGYEVYDFDITTGATDSQTDFDTVAEPGPKHFLIRGSVPLGHATIDVGAAMPDPANYTAHVLKLMLMARGVRVTGHARAQHAPPPPENPPGESASPAPSTSAPATLILAERDSPPLIEIVRVLNKVSQNLHAEILLRTVAKEKTGIGSLGGGLKIEQKFLTSIGIPLGDVLVDDGSGLSRENLVTPRAVVDLLEYIQQQPWGKEFMTTLPVAGLDGTLQHRMIGTPAEGRVSGKTGSVERTQAVSGFATTVRGEHLIFSMFVNHNGGPGRDAEKILDSILVPMVQDLGEAAKERKPKKHKR